VKGEGRALRTSGIGAALRRGLPKSKKPAFGKQKQALSFAATQRTGAPNIQPEFIFERRKFSQ